MTTSKFCQSTMKMGKETWISFQRRSLWTRLSKQMKGRYHTSQNSLKGCTLVRTTCQKSSWWARKLRRVPKVSEWQCNVSPRCLSDGVITPMSVRAIVSLLNGVSTWDRMQWYEIVLETSDYMKMQWNMPFKSLEEDVRTLWEEGGRW